VTTNRVTLMISPTFVKTLCSAPDSQTNTARRSHHPPVEFLRFLRFLRIPGSLETPGFLGPSEIPTSPDRIPRDALDFLYWRHSRGFWGSRNSAGSRRIAPERPGIPRGSFPLKVPLITFSRP